MSIFSELKESFSTIGLRRTSAVIIGRIADRIFDLYYGLETVGRVDLRRLPIKSPNLVHATRYQPTGILTFRSLIQRLDVTKDAVFLDIGCGKGRVLLLAASQGFKRVRGVEFSHDLCEIARRNIEAYHKRKMTRSEFEVIEADIEAYTFRDDENLFYFFDVFEERVMESIISRIIASVERCPRKAWLVYLHPRLGYILDRQTTFRPFLDSVLWGYAWKVYRHTPS